MRTSVNWINDYLDPPASAEEQAELLTRAGLPFDGREAVADSEGEDIRQEIETTSNRGDCLSHVGLAREVAALSGRRLRVPDALPRTDGPPAASRAAVVNERPDLCPLYTARVILGATIQPSPPWLAARLRAIGQIPRSNVVDATNYVLFELGQPTHVFDLDELRGQRIVVRSATRGERFLPLGDGAAEVELDPSDLVIADAERPVALAGIKGGAATAVREGSTNLLLEAATFDPVAVRRTARRLRIASDSSYRFERGVHPAQIDAASRRLAELILETAGGTLCDGVLEAGAAIAPLRSIELRVARCNRLLGVSMPTTRLLGVLGTLGFSPILRDTAAGEAIVACTVPCERLDIEREIDLVEEVARMIGLDTLPIAETIPVRVMPVERSFAARRQLRDALAGMDFVECVTHSLVSEVAATPFVPADAALLRVEDERARAEPILRPSIVPSLLRVRRHNFDHGVSELRLFEIASTFHVHSGEHVEHEALALVADAASLDAGAAKPGHSGGLAASTGLRRLRGVVERLVELVAGGAATLDVRPLAAEAKPIGWLAPAAELVLVGTAGTAPSSIPIGAIGLVSPAVAAHAGLELPLVAAELRLDALLAVEPSETVATALPAFPAIERDLSAIVEERVSWQQLRREVESLALPMLEAIEFVTAFRGGPISPGRKSVTLRLRFRAADQTLRRDAVDPQMERTVAHLRQAVDAEVRS